MIFDDGQMFDRIYQEKINRSCVEIEKGISGHWQSDFDKMMR
jgi:hypothetical protein